MLARLLKSFLQLSAVILVQLSLIFASAHAAVPAQLEYPEVLIGQGGKKIASVQNWKDFRKPELKRLFEEHIYGVLPPPPRLTFEVRSVPVDFTKKFRLKEILITFDEFNDKPNAPKIRLALFLPLEIKKQYPVFLALNKCGNQSVHETPALTIDSKAWQMDVCNDEGWVKRGARGDYWPVEYITGQGYAFATFHESDIEPDTHVVQANSLRNFITSSKDPKKNWGTIAIWAWGLSRAIDYLVRDDDVDPSKIFLTGHSRRGKAALFASATDERVAMVVPHQSGTFGMALSRNNNQETIEKINDRFPHWFSLKSKDYNGKEANLPVDQHMLVSLIAPRPVLSTEGIKDVWANYESGLTNLKLADEVYKFMGTKGLVGSGVVLEGQKMTASNTGRLAQVRLNSEHVLNRAYWERFIEFAKIHFK